ncbi:Uncharacterised protein [[Actinobacillus] rossii]|uniref:Uncharacterized protein n=1 Tax=[Actinobacillus] rossii TaxID=123820 RepID=A0A380TXR3_9PAST|nr:Uncharacterised protein [[Actinobacillus] rossii]
MFLFLRDLFAYAVILSALLLTIKIQAFSETMQHIIVIFTPFAFIVLHELIARKFKKEFDNRAYLSAIVGVALFAALGSFSKDELIELGFKIHDAQSFFIFKLYFHIWAILLLPIALRKFFKKD